MGLWVTMIRPDLTQLELGFTKESQLISPQALADLSGAPGHVPPSGSKFFHFHGKNRPNNRLVPHLGGWHPPQSGNPGSTTDSSPVFETVEKAGFSMNPQQSSLNVKTICYTTTDESPRLKMTRQISHECMYTYCKQTLYFHITFCY